MIIIDCRVRYGNLVLWHQATPNSVSTGVSRLRCYIYVYICIIDKMLTLPISTGKPDNELLDRSRTERCRLHASTGNSFSCIQPHTRR